VVTIPSSGVPDRARTVLHALLAADTPRWGSSSGDLARLGSLGVELAGQAAGAQGGRERRPGPVGPDVRAVCGRALAPLQPERGLLPLLRAQRRAAVSAPGQA